ncbi:hypothetical protein BD311DRAFT_784277 [Dichomitus squalens]|uniref:LYR motif-containing protein Cup1-like N-terminal domain-containing protein n=1 Tax=Dichomitus squalens TaxID=114155 RepID=A0A4Q9N6C5_9APHY|nr:hypothetical protein BD311DRAFT_784277 [Dichomitus squalens]
MHGDVKALYSLYRSALREIRRLPTDYLRQFFRLKVGDDVRGIFDAKLESVQASRVKRVQADLRRLRRANYGHINAFQHVMQTAYGRRGPLKWELLQPLRTEPGVEPPAPIIRSDKSSRPPVWSSELKALVSSDISRKKAIKPEFIILPPSIPAARLDPESPESRALGPFSRRREVNARWKYFKHQLDKTMFPLQIAFKQGMTNGRITVHTDEATLIHAGVRGIGLQGAGVFEELEGLASPPALVRLEEPSVEGDGDDTRQGPRPTIQSYLPRRFLRRRFQETLAQIPVLTYTLPSRVEKTQSRSDKEDVTPGVPGKPGRYQVTLSPKASTQLGPIQSIADEADVTWIRRAEQMEKGNGASKRG